MIGVGPETRVKTRQKSKDRAAARMSRDAVPRAAGASPHASISTSLPRR